MQRAKVKLETVRKGDHRDQPLGVSKFFVIVFGTFALVYVGMQSRGVFRLFDGFEELVKNSSMWSFWGLLAASFILQNGFFLWMILKSRPRRPKRAANRFYQSIAWGVFQNARRLTIASDLDDMPRVAVRLPNVSESLGKPVTFSSGAGYIDYWKAVAGLFRRKRRFVKVKCSVLKSYSDDFGFDEN